MSKHLGMGEIMVRLLDEKWIGGRLCVPVSVAAALLGYHCTTIGRLVRRGELRAQRDENGFIYIPRSSILAYKERCARKTTLKQQIIAWLKAHPDAKGPRGRLARQMARDGIHASPEYIAEVYRSARGSLRAERPAYRVLEVLRRHPERRAWPQARFRAVFEKETGQPLKATSMKQGKQWFDEERADTTPKDPDWVPLRQVEREIGCPRHVLVYRLKRGRVPAVHLSAGYKIRWYVHRSAIEALRREFESAEPYKSDALRAYARANPGASPEELARRFGLAPSEVRDTLSKLPKRRNARQPEHDREGQP